MEAADAATFVAGSGVGAGGGGLRCARLRYRDIEDRSGSSIVGHHRHEQFSASNDFLSTRHNDSGRRGDCDNNASHRVRLVNNDER